MITSKKRLNVVAMVELALLTAAVLILQLAGVAIKLPFLGTPVSLVLVPIALGAMLLGPWAGAWLGFVFGMVVFVVCGVMATDPFTAMLFADHPLLTALTCLVKSTLAGFLSGLVYRVARQTKPLLATFLAAGVVPVVNTGVFVLGCITMMDTVSGIAGGIGQNFLYFVIITCAGLNFIFEMVLNMALSPALCRVLEIVTRQQKRI
ncbi:MAG: ECF transporter S component [Clostridia bacterium]|nr:ECF transporter S component [Clostridia bacterium]